MGTSKGCRLWAPSCVGQRCGGEDGEAVGKVLVCPLINCIWCQHGEALAFCTVHESSRDGSWALKLCRALPISWHACLHCTLTLERPSKPEGLVPTLWGSVASSSTGRGWTWWFQSLVIRGYVEGETELPDAYYRHCKGDCFLLLLQNGFTFCIVCQSFGCHLRCFIGLSCAAGDVCSGIDCQQGTYSWSPLFLVAVILVRPSIDPRTSDLHYFKRESSWHWIIQYESW